MIYSILGNKQVKNYFLVPWKISFRYIESVKVASALLSYFSILPISSLLDKNALVRFAIQVKIHSYFRHFLSIFIY
jgi:hypothetical protein